MDTSDDDFRDYAADATEDAARDAALNLGPTVTDCATCGQVARFTCDSCDEPACQIHDCLVNGVCRKCDPESHAIAARSRALDAYDRRLGVR